MGSGAVCVEWRSTGSAHQFGFSPPRPQHVHGTAARSPVFGYELLPDQQPFSSSFHWYSEGLSSAVPRPCGDLTRYLISSASTHTHAGRFFPARRLMGVRVFLWSPACIANCSFSGLQAKCLRGKAVLVIPRLWRGIEARLVQPPMSLTKHTFLLHSRAPKATTRSHTFPTLLPQL